MVASTTSKIVVAISAAVMLVAVCVAVGYVLFVASGLGGWEPSTRSTEAARARAVDGQLRVGMTRDQVLAFFESDTHLNPGDGMQASLADSSDRLWDDEADLYINEPRRYFWSSYDTAWTVRAEFDSRGHLIHHRVDPIRTNGP